jgi:hypothetical protein
MRGMGVLLVSEYAVEPVSAFKFNLRKFQITQALRKRFGAFNRCPTQLTT